MKNKVLDKAARDFAGHKGSPTANLSAAMRFLQQTLDSGNVHSDFRLAIKIPDAFENIYIGEASFAEDQIPSYWADPAEAIVLACLVRYGMEIDFGLKAVGW